MTLEKIIYKTFNWFGVDHFEKDLQIFLKKFHEIKTKQLNVLDIVCYQGVFSKTLNNLI